MVDPLSVSVSAFALPNTRMQGEIGRSGREVEGWKMGETKEGMKGLRWKRGRVQRDKWV